VIPGLASAAKRDIREAVGFSARAKSGHRDREGRAVAETEGGSRDARPALGLARPGAPRPPNAHREPAVPRAAPNAARGSIARARLPRVGRRGGRPRRPPHDGRPKTQVAADLPSVRFLFFSFIANVSKHLNSSRSPPWRSPRLGARTAPGTWTNPRLPIAWWRW
jgi:hypothetical protein